VGAVVGVGLEARDQAGPGWSADEQAVADQLGEAAVDAARITVAGVVSQLGGGAARVLADQIEHPGAEAGQLRGDLASCCAGGLRAVGARKPPLALDPRHSPSEEVPLTSHRVSAKATMPRQMATTPRTTRKAVIRLTVGRAGSCWLPWMAPTSRSCSSITIRASECRSTC